MQKRQDKHIDNQNLNTYINLYPHSPRAYLNHEYVLRQDDVMHFLSDMSPNITMSKDESLDDENTSFQPNKVDMNNDKYVHPPTRIHPSSSIYQFGPSKHTYTPKFNEVYD